MLLNMLRIYYFFIKAAILASKLLQLASMVAMLVVKFSFNCFKKFQSSVPNAIDILEITGCDQHSIGK